MRATPDGERHTAPARTEMYDVAGRGLSAPMEADTGPPAMSETVVPTVGDALSAPMPPAGPPVPAPCQDVPGVAPLCHIPLAGHPLTLAVKDVLRLLGELVAPTAAGPPVAPLHHPACPSTPASEQSSADERGNVNKLLRRLPAPLELLHHLSQAVNP